MPGKLSLEKLIEKYAVKNALDYGGKPNIKSVVGKVLQENQEARKNVGEVIKKVNDYCKKIEHLSIEDLKNLASKYIYEEKKKELILELPNAENGKVVMRIAPFPSGPLHIGNARMAILNDELAKKYKGKLILMFDDTAGSKEKKPIREAYSLIPEDLRFLNVDFHEIVYKSDRMDLFYKYADEFLEKGWAYVCLCPSEKLRENRKKGSECEHRKYSERENLDLWRKMLKGEFKEGEASVRLKTSMKDKDPAFRDRVILRISDQEHPRVGNRYKVWPMLEFSWAIDDHELGMTHILRGKDLIMEDKMERFMWNLLGWRHPEIVHNGLLRLEGVKMSKSSLKSNVESGEYVGWHDPRSWSILSLKKRGIKPKAIRKFTLGFGMSENDVKVPVDNLYRENRVLIDKEVNRYFFLANPVEYKIQGFENKEIEIPLHPDFPKRGIRKMKIKSRIYIDANDEKNNEFRLKGLGNFKLRRGKLEFVDESERTAQKKKLQVIHWLPEGIECKVAMPDGEIIKGLCEYNILKEEEGNVVQFERFGFCRIENTKDLFLFFGHK